jgi:hypothetical protein
VNKAVYPHIAKYLSTACSAENAEYAVSELTGKAPRTIQQNFYNEFENDPVSAIAYAVAWTIENSMRKGGTIKTSLKDVTGAGENYTVTFTINGNDVSTNWIREYGIWRIRNFGEIAAGDKSLVKEREKKQQNNEKLRTDSNFMVEAGYANLIGKSSAFYAAVVAYEYIGGRIYFAGSDFYEIDFFLQLRIPVKLKSIAFIPYVNAGMGYQYDKAWEKIAKEYDGFPMTASVQLGMRMMFASVPGLSAGAGVQFNIMTINDNPDPLKRTVLFMAGYSF